MYLDWLRFYSLLIDILVLDSRLFGKISTTLMPRKQPNISRKWCRKRWFWLQKKTIESKINWLKIIHTSRSDCFLLFQVDKKNVSSKNSTNYWRTIGTFLMKICKKKRKGKTLLTPTTTSTAQKLTSFCIP